MKRLLCLLLVVSTLALVLSKTGLYFLFKVEQPYIARHLCEKKNEPQTKCQGKCYLKKQLKKETQRERQQAGQEKKPFLDLQLMAAQVEVAKPIILPAPQDFIPHSFSGDCTSPVSGIFHPPRHLTSFVEWQAFRKITFTF
ncbi:hypothetical protein [Rufibacter ruber]|uniref:hypothetical protein n=1 Tax=Rufibacter ruber TaxID=1783499 RepID=UPI00082CBD42|nr:hypothetical protein [Rufibacter ruber]